MCGARFFRLVFLLIVVSALTVSCLAQAPADTALTNSDIVKMMKAGISNIIVRTIQMSSGNFGTSAAALIDLKKHGASERILGAILDSRGGTSGSAFEPQTVPYSSTQSLAQHAHHLPSFEADLQVKSKTHSKVTVGQNHIEVKQAGVPVFSLKWKEKPADK